MDVNLVFEGLKFTVLGMSVVFLFLLFMVFVLQVQTKVITKFFPEKAPPKPAPDNSEEIVAAISAALIHNKGQ